MRPGRLGCPTILSFTGIFKMKTIKFLDPEGNQHSAKIANVRHDTSGNVYFSCDQDLSAFFGRVGDLYQALARDVRLLNQVATQDYTLDSEEN